jgi:NADPH:quinone reductase-like Zn-dependent oxidoreductase
MKAAVIDSLERGPRFADFAEPVVTGGETLIEVTAAGLHPIVRMLASGQHYGGEGALPMIPGIDGTGRAPDGTRVYFVGVRPPYGLMAQRAAAAFTLPLPDGLDEVTAAAIVNPGNGAWLALSRQAALQPGETVLVLGATGVSGRIAVALAARMGAGRVIAAGRNRAILDQLGATATVVLGGPDDRAALAQAAGPDGINVIIDYLWGPPTEATIAAISRRGMMHTAPRVRLVEVGQIAGPTVSLPANVLLNSGLQVLGSGRWPPAVTEPRRTTATEQRPCPPGRLTPARVRRGFRNIRQTLPDLAGAPKPGKPGPGRPPGSKNRRPATRHDVGKTVKRDQPSKKTRRQKG